MAVLSGCQRALRKTERHGHMLYWYKDYKDLALAQSQWSETWDTKNADCEPV